MARDPSLPPAVPSKPNPTAVPMAWAGILVSATISLVSNVDFHVHGSNGHYIVLAAMFGFGPPVLAAILGHMASVSARSGVGKGIAYALTAVMMAVSAYGTASVMYPSEHSWVPAIGQAVGMDSISIYCLVVLIEFSAKKLAYEEWVAQAEHERQQLAAQAEYEALAGRYARPGSGGGNGRGSSAGSGGGSAIGVLAGNTPALPPGNSPPPPALPAAPAGGRVTAPEAVPAEPATGPMGTVTDIRKPAMSDTHMRVMAAKLADDLEKVGQELSIRAFQAEFGGKTARVGPVVKAVKEARAAGAGAAVAAGDR